MDATTTQEVTPRPDTSSVLTAVVGAAAAVVVLNTMLNPALPAMAIELGASQTELHWMVDIYALALAALLLPAGAIGDRFGRRTTLLAGLAVVMVGNALGAVADGPGLVIVSRAVAGVGAAFLFPSTLSTITATFPPTQRARGVGIWSAATGSAGVAGILISGGLVENFWPGSVFVFGTALSAAVLVLAWRVVPDSADPADAHLDPLGAVLVSVGVTGLVLAIIEGPNLGWGSSVVLIGLVVGLAALIAFVLWELSRERPLLDVRLLALPGVSAGAITLLTQFVLAFGLFFTAFFYMGYVLDYGAIRSGVALLPLFIGTPLATIAIPLSRRIGRGPVMAGGLLIGGVGAAMCALLDVGSSYWLFAAALAVLGVALVVSGPPATEAIVEALPPAKQGVASAVNDVVRELAAAIGIAVTGALFNSAYRNEVSQRIGQAIPADALDALRDSPAAGPAVATQLGSDGAAVVDAARQAVMAGFSRSMWFLVVVAVAGAGFVAVRTPRGRGAIGTPAAPVAGDAAGEMPAAAGT